MKYSIVIPIYNTAQYLEECVLSALTQTGAPKYEIILVDDGSTDASGAICDKLAEKYSAVRAYHNKNSGVCAARNFGMRKAGGDYILFLDSDDMWMPELLQTVDALTDGAPDMIFFNLYDMSQDGSVKTERRPNSVPTVENGKDYLRGLFSASCLPIPYVWRTAYRRSFLERNNILFNETLCASEDFDFNMACYFEANRLAGTEKPLYCYRHRAGSLSKSPDIGKVDANIRNKAYWYRKMPDSVLADDFLRAVLWISRLEKGTDMRDILSFTRDNRDIIGHSRQRNLILAKFLMKISGIKNGAVAYCAIREAYHSLHKRVYGKN